MLSPNVTLAMDLLVGWIAPWAESALAGTVWLLLRSVGSGTPGMAWANDARGVVDVSGAGCLTCLRAPTIAALVAADGPLQVTLIRDRRLLWRAAVGWWWGRVPATDGSW